jgi:ATP-dependent Clp protease ATP-binding subunit ClpC
MFDRFSEHSRNLMRASRDAAQEFKHDYIGTEHILLGIVAQDGTVATTALRTLGVDPARVRGDVAAIVRPGTHDETGQIPFTPRGKRALEFSLEEAQEAGHLHIGTGHLLLGLIREGQGIAAQVLGRLELTLDRVRPVVLETARAATDPRDDPRKPGPVTSASLGNLMAEAFAHAENLGRTTVEPQDVLLAMVAGDGVVARVLRELGATPEGIRNRIEELRDS